jgi:hypothetical protein
MKFISDRPALITPEAKLASTRWRFVNSWWILVPLFSLGLLGWLGFLFAAVRTGKRAYWVGVAIYSTSLIVFLGLVIAFPVDSTMADLGVIPFLGAWFGATIHAAILNRGYLRTLAAQGNWYSVPQAGVTPSASDAQPFLGVASSEYYRTTAGAGDALPHRNEPTATPWVGTPATPARPIQTARSAPNRPAPIAIATATREELIALPGVDHALANRIVAIRDARGGYRDLDDLGVAANLKPHELVRLRNHVSFGSQVAPKQALGRQQSGPGRILDI